MTDYRLYFIDPAGHIARAVLLDCLSDEAAVTAAHEQAEGCSVELWQRNRRVPLPALGRISSVG